MAITATIKHTFAIEPITKYGVKHSSESSDPSRMAFRFGQYVCICDTEADAKRVAEALAKNIL